MSTYKRTLQEVTSYFYRWEPNGGFPQTVKVPHVYTVDIYAWYRCRGVKHRDRLPKGNRTRAGANVEPKPNIVPDREQARRDWRDRKQFNRDRIKGRGHYWGGQHSSPRQHAVKQSSRKIRQWENRLIAHERWDDLAPEMDKYFRDRWIWD